VRRGETMIDCENCGAIMVWGEDSE
jgi:predicted  nucleic acid-binding Zn-ribbon protein